MAFDTIYDQSISTTILGNLIRKNRIPHGLLFYGPSGVGKSMAAIEFAKALNCKESETDACGECISCKKIDHGNHPDISVTVPVKKSRIIDVEAVDDIIGQASLRPFEAEWRIFIIQDAERMRGPAQNHLLKTLEEPPGQSLFILISEFPQILLPTIRSRCQRIRFGALSPETVKTLLLRKRDLDEELAESIAAISQGQMTRAFSLVDSDKREMALDIVKQLQEGIDPLALSEEFAHYLTSQKSEVEAAVKARTDAVDKNELSKEDLNRHKEEQQALVDALVRQETMEFLYLLEIWYRDTMVYHATGDLEQVLNKDQAETMEETSDQRLEEKLKAIDKARIYLERFINEERVFRDLFFALAS
jgi:DNA polymerase-3 subunit delta'